MLSQQRKKKTKTKMKMKMKMKSQRLYKLYIENHDSDSCKGYDLTMEKEKKGVI
jgi:hypothetical protein